MFGRETRMLLRHYLEQGTSKSALARQLGVSRDTIHRWIRDGDLDRDCDDEGGALWAAATVPTKLDPTKPIIEARLAVFPALSAVRLLEEIRAAGYTGGYSQLTAFVQRVRPTPAPEPVIRFETPAGRQAQVDFARFQFAWGVRYALLVVLGYSRLLWCRFYPRQDMAHADRRSRGCLPRLRRRAAGVALRSNEGGDHAGSAAGGRSAGAQSRSFSDSRTTGASRCVPVGRIARRPKAKSSVPVRYLRGNFVYGRTFLHDADLDQQRQGWLDRVANVRLHGTTRERPRERFDREERFLLQPLAARRYTSLVVGDRRGRRRCVDASDYGRDASHPITERAVHLRRREEVTR